MNSKLQDTLMKYLMPIANKIEQQKHLQAIKDGMIAVIPVIIVGSISLLPLAFANLLGSGPIYDFLTAHMSIFTYAGMFISLIVILFFIGRRYINVGTLLYIIPYGFCVNAGNTLYRLLAFSDGLMNNIIFAIAGCLILYMGVAFCITADIGVDPFSGIVLTICDATKKEYRVIKVAFDITMVIVGTLLGGKLGVITVIAAVSAGPLIQVFGGILKKNLLKSED